MIDWNRPIVGVVRDLGIGSSETLRNWVKQARRDAALEVGPTTEGLAEIKRLRKEVADQTQPPLFYVESVTLSNIFTP